MTNTGTRTSRLGPAPGLGMSAPVGTRTIVALDGSVTTGHEVTVAEEVPVAFIYGGKPYVVMMCTPADLEDLAVGFTVSEEIAGAVEIGEVVASRHSRGIELVIPIPPGQSALLADRTRAISGRSGCGLCGVEAIDAAIRAPRPVTSSLTIARAALWRAGQSLEDRQPVNRETRTVHAAAWANANGELVVVREDVGRHNALDKVIGALARAGTDAGAGFLVVTSRASYELVQKTAAAGVPLLAAVSRATGLAVRFADEAGITLVGLLRGRTAIVYTHVARLTDPAT